MPCHKSRRATSQHSR